MSTALADFYGPSADYFAGADPETISAFAVEAARQTVLGEIREVVGWLADETCHVENVSSEWELRDPIRIDAASTATVLHALLTCCDADMRQCRDLLVSRYLRDRDARVAELAEEYEG